ncbi:fibronectin type III domain-containing protein [Actinoplanes sp. NPDC049548]|uniref:fibronectin type III domain-containing protein n=1 Tax=Actinoplanes sp. NPDC049548 TaxID=3155152 RepID=UPI0034428CF6
MSPRTMGLRLTAAAIIPLALGGCDLPGALGGKQASAAAPADENAAAAKSWIIVDEGARQEKEVKPVDATPSVEATHAASPLPAPAHTDPPVQRCVSMFTRGRIAPLHVDAGTRTATVSWYHPGDPTVLTYRITSFNQTLRVGEQKPLTWQESKPAAGCATMTTTIRGLQPGTPYVFSVDVLRRASTENTARSATIARSGVVYTD